MRAATSLEEKLKRDMNISIHAAHEGCDTADEGKITWIWVISIHAAHEGCDP